jgi:rare lipoprotein A
MPVHLPLADGIFRIKLGPIKNQLQLETLLQSLKSGGYPEAFAVN